MKTGLCWWCAEEKPIGDFYKDGGIACKECRRRAGRQRYQANRSRHRRRRERYLDSQSTWWNFAFRRWPSLNTRTINGSNPKWNQRQSRHYLNRGIRLEMTKEEFYSWCKSQSDAIDAILDAGETPSIDRIDSDGHYALDNIRVISLRENCRLANATR